MKGFLLIVCFVAAISSGTCTHGEKFLSGMRSKYLSKYLEERDALDEVTNKIEEICPGSKIKLETAFDEMKECADKIDETAETSCSIAKNKMPKCLEPLVKVAKDCMPEESKELPEFFMKSLLKTVDYICKTDGEHIFELGNACLYKKNPVSDVCRRKMTMRMHTYGRNGFGVEDVCSVMNYMKPCLKSHLSLSCGSPITQEAVIGVYDAVMTNCKTIADATSNELKETKDVEVSKLEDFA